MRANVAETGDAIWYNIELLRASRQLTREKIAEIAGVSLNTLKSRRDIPGNWTLGQLAHIAAYFGKTLDWLLAKQEI